MNAPTCETSPGAPNLYEGLNDVSGEGSRPLGVIDPGQMANATLDNDAVNVVVDGRTVPVLVPVKYAYGYEASRCHAIVDEDDPAKVLYYSLPARVGSTALSTELASKLAQRRYGFIFYDSTERDEVPPLLVDALEQTGHDYEELPLLDEDAATGNEQASISLYGFDLPVEKPDETAEHSNIDGWYDLYRQGVTSGKYAHDTDNGTVMIKGNEIDEALFEKLWAIYQERFQWLGEKHPVSMEDTREGFNSLLRNSSTLASIQYHDSEPVCFTYFSEGTESLFWLNREFLSDKDKMRMNDGQTILFFPGIVSSEKSAGYSMPVIGLLANTAFDYNGNFRIIFENTNRSEVYIPRLVRTIINRLGRGKVEAPELLDRTVYGCVRFGSRPIEDSH